MFGKMYIEKKEKIVIWKRIKEKRKRGALIWLWSRNEQKHLLWIFWWSFGCCWSSMGRNKALSVWRRYSVDRGSSQLCACVWHSVVEEVSQGNTCSYDNCDDAVPTCAMHSQRWQGCNTDIATLLQLWHQCSCGTGLMFVNYHGNHLFCCPSPKARLAKYLSLMLFYQ